MDCSEDFATLTEGRFGPGDLGGFGLGDGGEDFVFRHCGDFAEVDAGGGIPALDVAFSFGVRKGEILRLRDWVRVLGDVGFAGFVGLQVHGDGGNGSEEPFGDRREESEERPSRKFISEVD